MFNAKQFILLAFGFFLVMVVLSLAFAIIQAFPHGVHVKRGSSTGQETMTIASSTKNAKVTIRGAEFSVMIADTTSTRTQGLSNHAPLGEREGMLFLFPFKSPQLFWMKDMLFPLDMIWIKNGAVTGVTENAVPEPGMSLFRLKLYNSPGLVDQVLEVSAGTAKKFGIAVGDAVSVALP